jgi:hypothetical protein
VPTEAYKGTPQGETTEGNAVDYILMVDQGLLSGVDIKICHLLNLMPSRQAVFFLILEGRSRITARIASYILSGHGERGVK